MGKKLMGPTTMIYPAPVLLVGVNVNDKPNFMTVAWGGIVNSEPPMISVAIQHIRYTHLGIQQNLTFSVNIPSVDQVKEADYCGSSSGVKVDKVKVCRFKVFYGKLGTAPLIEQCPINMECRVVHILDLGSHSLVVGKIEETYVSEVCLTDGKPDIDKIKPFAYIVAQERQYQSMGDVIGKAFSIGLKLKKRE